MTRYLIANWKMNLPPEGVDGYLDAVRNEAGGDVTIAVAPPFPFIRDVAARARRIVIAAQNCSDHPAGAYTGEVSASMVRYSGATSVILGHSERRSLFHENDALIARKLAIAVETGLKPVLCVGEDLKTREAGAAARFLADQIRETAIDALANAAEIVIAYEPVWAIGTGRNATAAMVAETIGELRHALSRFWPARHAGSAILYGGSVTPENASELMRGGSIDGFLVGGASLDSRKFLAIQAAMLDVQNDSGKNSHP